MKPLVGLVLLGAGIGAVYVLSKAASMDSTQESGLRVELLDERGRVIPRTGSWTVQPGATGSVRVTVLNKSMQGAANVAARLKIVVATGVPMDLSGADFTGTRTLEALFGPSQEVAFTFPWSISASAGAADAQVAVSVYGPDGGAALASAQDVVHVVPPTTYGAGVVIGFARYAVDFL